ncbi:MAG: porin family protein [Bacteroidales bacterium]|nr:porin family protein [Bacteroidales bacterium]
MRLSIRHFPLLLLLVILCCSKAVGQVNYTGTELAVGVKGGTTFSLVTFSPSVNQKLKLGYMGGVVFRYSGEKNLALQVEANYIQKGWQETDADFNRTLNYVEVPLLSHFFFGKGVFRWIINIGPQISFLVNENIVGDATEPQHTELVKRRFDYGLCAGTGFEINTHRGGIYQLEARFAYSFSDFFDNSYSAQFQKSTSMALMVTAAVLFNTK